MQQLTQSQVDNQMLGHWLGGGLAVGGSAALLTSLVNHFKTLNEKAERAKDTSGDDDVLYVNLRHGQPKVATTGGTAVAMTSAAIGAPVGYALIRKLYEKQKRKAMQKELDEAQNAYLDTMAPRKDGEKEASFWDKALAMPGVATLLLAASSGVLTNKILDKNFPAPKAPASIRPRRLVLRDQPPVEEEEEVREKAAAEADASEGLLAMVLAHREAGEASGLGDLLKAAAAGRTEEILHASDEGIDTMFEVVKSAGVPEPTTALQRDLATGWLVREPEIAEAIKLAAALEFSNAYPMAMAMASAVPADMQDDMIKLSALFRQYYRAASHEEAALPQIKSAYGVSDALQEALQAVRKDRPEDQLDSGESADSTESPVKVEAKGPKAKAMLVQNRDAIDEILTTPGKPKPEV